MRTTAPSLIVLTHDGGQPCVVNLSQVEVIEPRWDGAEITFASGTTLAVDETLERILASAQPRLRTRKPLNSR